MTKQETVAAGDLEHSGSWLCHSFALRSRKAALFVISIALAGMVWAVYGQTLHHEFVSYDDSVYVYENPAVKRGVTVHGILRAFTFAGIGHWHPLTWISHMLDYQVYGPWAGGHHLTSVLLHAASVTLLFLVLRGMTGALWRSAFVAALFAVHPLHVESVAWVAERKDVLSGLFFMLTLGAYARYARGPRSPGRYIPVALLFAVGLMCKDMLVTLPCVLLLLDWWPLGRWKPGAPDEGEPLSRLILEKIPLFALFAASCIITVLAPEKLAAAEKLPFLVRLENALVSCVIYLRQMVWPAGLAVPYPNPTGYFPAGEVLLALALLAAISAAAFIFGIKRPWLAVGWLWYLGMLAPVIGIVQISTYAHADRYTYLPQIGLYIAVAWLAAEGCARLRHGRLLAGCVSAIILTALMLCARGQTAWWKDDETLWLHTLAVMPGNAAAHNNLGLDVEKNGQTDQAIAHYREAISAQPNLANAHYNLANALVGEGRAGEGIAEYEKALEIQPEFADAHNNLGNVLLDKGRGDEAIAHFQAALEIQPRNAKIRNNIGNAFLKIGATAEAVACYEQSLKIQPGNAEANYNLGNILLQTGHLDEAAAHFQKALESQPGMAAANYNLGLILQRKGQTAGAMALFQKSLATEPGDAEAHVSLGNALLQTGRVDEAVTHFQKALEIQPDLAKAHINLAVALVQEGHSDEAIPHLQRALEIQPNLAKAHSNLGVILLQKGRLDEAIAHFQKALEIQPSLAEAHYNLGISLVQKEQFSEAIEHLQKAVELQPGYTDAQNSLARLLATCPQASLRNGAKALELAVQASQSTGGGNPAVLGTLAAAYAECGRFSEAVETAQRAIELSTSQGDSKLANDLQEQIALYRNNTPFRETDAKQ